MDTGPAAPLENGATPAQQRRGRPIADRADVAARGARAFALPGGSGTGFLVCSGQGLRAYVDSCPHVPGSGLSWRVDEYLDAGRQFIFCASHGARFRLDDGVCVSGPCPGERLTPLQIEVDERGRVFLLDSSQV